MESLYQEKERACDFDSQIYECFMFFIFYFIYLFIYFNDNRGGLQKFNGMNHRWVKCYFSNHGWTMCNWAKPQVGKVYFPHKKIKS